MNSAKIGGNPNKQTFVGFESRISKDVALSKVTDFSELAITLTSKIICRVAFGKRFVEEGKRFQSLVNQVETVLGGFFVENYFPYMGWIDVLTGMRSRLQRIFIELDDFYQEIIDDHLDSDRPAISDAEDFVDVLIGIKRDRRLFSTELTWDHIKGVLMNLFLGGTDTGAATLVWTMTMMMKHPNVLKKVQEEIRANIVTGNRSIIPEEDVEKLPYFKAVVKESMRMHPASPLIPRETLHHCNIDGYDIAPKTQVLINTWAIGRDSEAWERPDEFCPERFLGSSVDFRGHHYELLPFGSGRRICPGINLGMAAVNLALLNLLYSFDWELPSGMSPQQIDTTTLPGSIMHKKVPLCLLAKQATR